MDDFSLPILKFGDSGKFLLKICTLAVIKTLRCLKKIMGSAYNAMFKLMSRLWKGRQRHSREILFHIVRSRFSETILPILDLSHISCRRILFAQYFRYTVSQWFINFLAKLQFNSLENPNSKKLPGKFAKISTHKFPDLITKLQF